MIQTDPDEVWFSKFRNHFLFNLLMKWIHPVRALIWVVNSHW